jgi:hypothetical protein
VGLHRWEAECSFNLGQAVRSIDAKEASNILAAFLGKARGKTAGVA